MRKESSEASSAFALDILLLGSTCVVERWRAAKCFPARAPARDNLDPPYRKELHRVDATVATAIIRAHDVIIAGLSFRLAGLLGRQEPLMGVRPHRSTNRVPQLGAAAHPPRFVYFATDSRQDELGISHEQEQKCGRSCPANIW